LPSPGKPGPAPAFREAPDGGGVGTKESEKPDTSPAVATKDAPAPESRLPRPIRLWPLFDLRDYDLARHGPDARLTDYIRSFDVEALWPLFAHYEWEKKGGVRGGHTHVFPLFWSSWKDEIGYSVLFPFYWSHWTASTSWTHLFPLYGEYRKDDYIRTFLLDPLFSWGSDSKTGEWDVDLFWPLIHFEGGSDKSAGRIAPFIFYGRSDDLDYTYIPPLYFHHHRAGRSGTRIVFPLYWEHWKETGRRPTHRVVAPFYGRFEWEGAKGLNRLETAMGLYWKYRGATEADVVFPLYWDFRGKRSRTRLILPLWLEWENRSSRGEVLFPFYWNLGKTAGDVKTLALPPVYFLKTDRVSKKGVQAVTPFFWNWWSPEGAGWALLPLYGRHRGKDLELDTVLPPVFWFTKSGNTRGFVAAPFWWQFENEREGRHFRSLFPLYWDFKERRGATRGTILFPFYADIRTDRGKKGVVTVPPYLRAWSGENHWTLLLPLWAEACNARRDSRWRSVLPPLYWWYRSPTYESEVLPPWWRFEDETKGTCTRGIFPLYWETENKRRDTHAQLLIPAYLDVDTGPEEKRFTLLPFFWRYEDRSKASELEGVFPLFWNFSWKGGEEKFTTLFPFVWYFRNPSWSFEYVAPFWGRYEEKDGYRRDFILFPLASVERDPARDAFGADVLWPLFSYRDTPKERSWRALPFWLHHTRKSDGRNIDMVLPFVCSMNAKDWRYRHVFPFYFDYLDRHGGPGKEAGWNSVLGPLWVRTFDEEKDLTRHDVLWPLFTSRTSGDERSVSLRPLFYHTADAKSSGTVLLPLLFHRRWEEGSQTAVLPLFWQQHKKDRTSRMVAPLYFEDYDDKEGARILFPLHWNFWGPRHSYLHWWPFFGLDRETDAKGKGWRRTSFLFPFFRFETDDSIEREVDVHAPWPLVHYSHDQPRGDYSFHVLPFFGTWGSSGRGRFLSALPPAWWSWDRNERTVLLPFVYHHRNRRTDRTENVVFPFLWSFESPRSSSFHLWPLFGRSVETSPDGALKRLEISSGWPFLFRYAENRVAQSTELDILWPLIHYENSEQRDRFRIAPLIWYGRDEGEEQWSAFFPLWIQKRSLKEENRWKIDVLWPLFSASRKGGESHSRLLPLWWHDSDEKESLTVVPLLSMWLYRSGDLTSAGLLFPLCKYRNDRRTRETQLDVLWPLFSYRREGRFSHSRLLPLWWHDSDEKKSLTVIPPLLSFHRRSGSSGFGSFLFPLTWYSWEKGESFSFRVLWELASYRESGDAWDFRVLYKFIHLGRRGPHFEFELMPLFRFETVEGRLTHFSLLGGALFSYDWDTARQRSETSLFYFIRF